MDENLRQGIHALANTGLSLLQRKAEIETKTQYDTASTQIAGEIDRFNLDLDKDPDYNSYEQKWQKKQQEIMKYTGTVKSPDAKRAIEQFMQRINQSQATILQQKTDVALRQDTYVNRTGALNTRLQQTAIPINDKLLDIDTTIAGLMNDGIVDRLKSQQMSVALGSAAIGQDLVYKAGSIYRQVEAEHGPEVALNAADQYIQEYQDVFTVGGQKIGSTIQDKAAAQNSIRDIYTITTREKKAAMEKLLNEEDGKLYGGYSAYVNGDPRGLTYTAIDNSKLPVERKMYWRSQLEEAENAKNRPDAALEAEATDFWNKLTIFKTEMKRNGGALNGEVVVRLGEKTYTFRDMNGLQEAIKDNYATLNKVFGKGFAQMYDGFISDLDKPAGVADATRDRILSLAKDKKNPIPDWEANEYAMMFDAWAKSKGGKPSLEEADAWYKDVVLKPKLNKAVKEIGYGAWFPDNDDQITLMMAEGAFKNDIADGRPVNPRTRDGLMSWAAAVEKEYAKIENVTAGKDFSTSWTSGGKGLPFYFRRELKDAVETTAAVPFGSNKETNLVKFTYTKNNILQTVEAYDVGTKKWRPAQQRKDNNMIWDFSPEATRLKQSEADALKKAEAKSRGEGTIDVNGSQMYINPALGGF